MRVLVVSNMYPNPVHPSYGIFVKKFCNQLDDIGIDYSLSVMRKSDSRLGKIVGYLSFYFSTFIKVLFGNYSVIYVHYPSFSGAPVDLATKFRKRTVYTNLHGSDVVPESQTHEKMQKYTKNLIKKSKKIIVPSKYFRNLVARKYDVNKDFIYVYPSGGIDTSIFYKKDKTEIDEFKNKYGINEKFPVFGMAGRISKDKGWDTFIDVVSELDIDACFVIVGTGNEDKKLEAKLVERKLSKAKKLIWINKLLPQEELATFYNVCDYFVFPTKRAGESLGLVAVEAMPCGTPVIASDYAAPKYYIQESVNGFKFDIGNVDSLKNVIEKAFMLNDEDKIKLEDGALKTSEQYYGQNLLGVLKEIFE